MKAILEFELSGEFNEQPKLDLALKAQDMSISINEVYEYFRKMDKHDCIPEYVTDKDEMLDHVVDVLREEFKEFLL